MYYYFGYFVDKGALFTFLQKFGLVNISGESHGAWHGFLNSFGLIAQEDRGNVFEVGFSFFNMLGQLVNIIGIILLAGPLSNRFGKRSTFIVGLFLTAVFTGLFMTAKPDRVGYVYLLNLLKSLAYAPTIPLLWSMMADVADYSEWKYARRATGFVFAGIVFALKAGLGFGGAICGWIVNAFGYVPNAVQDSRSILGIRLASSIIPAFTFFIGVIVLFTYKITKKFNEEIQAELTQRRTK